MEINQFRPELFIEGNETPEEEHPYWRLTRGQVVPLSAFEVGPPLYRLAVRSLGLSRKLEEVIYQDEGETITGIRITPEACNRQLILFGAD